MKTILCFGDSNTWGFNPESIAEAFPRRHAPGVRWTGVLAQELGADWRIIEEGQNGRTTVHDDPFYEGRNGKAYLPACLESHKPLDLVILMLGTNDLKSTHNVPPGEIAKGVSVLAKIILTSDAGPGNKPPRLLLLSPPKVGNLSHLPDLEDKIPDGISRSEKFPKYYEALARVLECDYLNTQAIVETSAIDGVHLEADEHGKLGRALAEKIGEMF